MASRVGFEPLLALNGLVDLAGRDDSLLLQSMRNHDSVPTVEEVLAFATLRFWVNRGSKRVSAEQGWPAAWD